MKVVILAGGLGTRISEESHLKPKPMIEIGEMPIIVHIMKIFAAQGYKDFIICAGYKQQVIKEYFAHYFLYTNDVTFDMQSNQRIIHTVSKDDWKVTVVNTGLNTQTGGRLKRVKKYLDDEPFFFTYGDAVGNVDLKKVLESHQKSGAKATISVYNFGQSKGVVELTEDGKVSEFREKSDVDGDLINIGYMVLNPDVLDYIEGDKTVFEKDVLNPLAAEGNLNAYVHEGFWQCMDTMKEKEKLEKLWSSGKCPWKIWRN